MTLGRPTACVLACLAALLLASCRQYLPTNRFLQARQGPAASHSTADARGKFDHGTHSGVLEAGQVACIDCHRFDMRIEAADNGVARELSRRGMHPGGAACHHCHGVEEARSTRAPAACTTCHTNLEPLRPPTHDLAWLKAHATMARVEPNSCESCHRQSSCIDCHARRDTIQTAMHERNFRFFHSIQARANPMQCGSCHRQDFCSNCHQQGRIGVTP